VWADGGKGFNVRAIGGSHDQVLSGLEVRGDWKYRQMGLYEL